MYVFRGFTIGEGKRLEIDLRQIKGNQFLQMEVKRIKIRRGTTEASQEVKKK